MFEKLIEHAFDRVGSFQNTIFHTSHTIGYIIRQYRHIVYKHATLSDNIQAYHTISYIV